MKKTLLLVSVALAAMTVNAQEVWTAESLIPADAEPSNGYNITDQATITEGDNPSGVLTFGTENVSVEAVSTPYPDKFVESPDGPEIEDPTVWEISASENEQLINEPVFKARLKGQGNPTLTRTGAWYETDNGWAYRPGADDEIFVPGTSTGAPQFGTYYKMTFKSAGTVRVGVYINKGNHSFYALDVETLQLIPVSSLSAEGYTQNNTFVPADGLDPFQPVTIDDSYVFKIEGQNRPVLCLCSRSRARTVRFCAMSTSPSRLRLTCCSARRASSASTATSSLQAIPASTKWLSALLTGTLPFTTSQASA